MPSDYLIEKDKLKALEDTKNSEGLDGAYYVCFYGNQMYLFSALLASVMPSTICSRDSFMKSFISIV